MEGTDKRQVVLAKEPSFQQQSVLQEYIYLETFSVQVLSVVGSYLVITLHYSFIVGKMYITQKFLKVILDMVLGATSFLYICKVDQ